MTNEYADVRDAIIACARARASLNGGLTDANPTEIIRHTNAAVRFLAPRWRDTSAAEMWAQAERQAVLELMRG